MAKAAVAKSNIRLMDKVVNEALSDHRALYREWLDGHVVKISAKRPDSREESRDINKLVPFAKS
jgi:hypothetical protein